MSLTLILVRADLGVALSTGRKALFFAQDIPWKSLMPSKLENLKRWKTVPGDISSQPPVSEAKLVRFICRLDPQLRGVWNDIMEFSRVANVVSQCRLTMDDELYHELMISAHYRLIHLRFQDGTDEIMRLAVLAFTSSIFLQWRDIKIPTHHLSQSFWNALCQFRWKCFPVPLSIKLWLHIIFFITFLDENQQAASPVLINTLQELRITHWEQVRNLVKTVLWVDKIHDTKAKLLVENALAGQND